MKIRLVALCVGVLGILGLGAAPATASQASANTCPILYPFCG